MEARGVIFPHRRGHSRSALKLILSSLRPSPAGPPSQEVSSVEGAGFHLPLEGEVGPRKRSGMGDSASTYAASPSPHPGLPSAAKRRPLPSPFRGGWST